MSEQSDKPTANGVDPLQRLASIKPPRDLSLGGVKPNVNKKVFTPNLNVTRNRNKRPEPNVLNNKREDKGKRDRNRNKNFKNGPNIIKSAGVFSEGLGSAEISRRSAYFGRDSDPRPTLQKPTIRVKDVVKIDKEFEEQRIRSVVGDNGNAELESEDFKHVLAVDAPVKLPMDDGGWVHSQPKPPVKVKQEVVVKEEPADDVECSVPAPIIEEKPKVDVKELFDDTNVVNLLRSENPTLILLQLPDTLPGRGGSTEDETPRRRQGPSTSSGPEKSEEKPADNRCRLSDLEEGRVGTLQVHRSGKVTFKLGDTAFEVCSGTKAAFHQEVVSVSVDESSRSACVISLGPLQHKLNITPEWESMFSKIVV